MTPKCLLPKPFPFLAVFSQVRLKNPLGRLNAILGFLSSYPAGSHREAPLKQGGPVRVRRLARSPLPGQDGILALITPDDPRGPYLVQFENGLRYRYDRSELDPLPLSRTANSGREPGTFPRNIESLRSAE